MRQPFPSRRQSVLFLGAHLAEGAVEAVGQEQRVVAEAVVAARRPDDDAIDAALEVLDMAVGPGQAERGDEMRAPLSACGRCVRLKVVWMRFMAARKSLSGPAQRAE